MPPTALVAAAAAGVLGGVATGVAVTVDARYGLLLAVAAVAVPIALIDVPIAAAVWVGLAPLSGLTAFGLAANAAGVLLLFAWLAWVPARRAQVAEAIGLHRRLLLGIVLLLVWFALTMVWAQDPGKAALELSRWCISAGALLVLVTSARTERDVVLVVVALIAGTVASVAIGLAGGGLGAQTTATATASATATEGRLQGGADDPNFLAAYVVAALVLAAAVRSRLAGVARAAVPLAVAVLVAGLFATESRGGIIAAVAAVIFALALIPGRRLVIGACAVVFVLGAAVDAAVEPSVVQRITSAANDRGNGRQDLWTVAGRMSADHPVIGVGLDNFEVRAGEYVRRPGTLEFVDLIVDRPHEVHNTYLQVLSGTGVIGLGLFLAVVAAAMGSALRAARRFEAAGAIALGRFARGVLVADVAFLVAGVFLSAGSRPTLWTLLATGPMLLGLTARR